MRRLQGSFASRDPEEERKKARDNVMSNIVIFGVMIAMIRTAPFIINSL